MINLSPSQAQSYLTSLFGLNNRVAIVTGGMGKLGTEFVQTLLYAGARVAVFDKITEPNETLKELAQHFSLSFHQVDLLDEEQIILATKHVEEAWETPTILVNNAGWRASPNIASDASVPFEQYPIAHWDEVFAINTKAAAACAKAAASSMIRAKKSGVIINILSVFALVAPDQSVYTYREKIGKPLFVKDPAYSASKAALLALTHDLAVQWAPHQIRVVAISPGGVENPQSDPEFVENYCQRVPMGRMAKQHELNGALLFLASDSASYITGANIIVDGGLSIW